MRLQPGCSVPTSLGAGDASPRNTDLDIAPGDDPAEGEAVEFEILATDVCFDASLDVKTAAAQTGLR